MVKVRKCDSGYETLDGRYVIERQDDVTECDHPLCDTLHRRFHNPGRGVMHSVLVPQWHVWDNQAAGGRGDYAGHGDGRGFETKRAAEMWLHGHLADKD